MPLQLLPRLVLITAAATALTSLPASDIGRRFPSEKRTFTDQVTGVELTALTTSAANDLRIYQTHPQWTADGKWIVFRSDRHAPPADTPAQSGKAAPKPMQVYAVHEQSGEIVQLTDGPASFSGMLTLAEKSMKLYFLRYSAPGAAAQMIELNLETLLADSAAGTMKDPTAYERVCGRLPEGMVDSGGFDLDADEEFAYIGVKAGDTGQHLAPGTKIVETAPGQRMGAGPAGLRSMNLKTGEVKVIIDTPFLMGHVQTNPWVPGEIIYCHETGGDAPQRMWTVRADGTENRPLYPESPDEWVTHEAVITKDEVVFNILGHQPKLRMRPTGIAVINLRSNHVKLYGQVEDQLDGARGTGGYWHCQGSSDGRWLLGDTFAGNIWLIDRQTGRQTLLTTDHRMTPDHAHPTFSPDNRRILIQSGQLSDGKSLDLIVFKLPETAK